MNVLDLFSGIGGFSLGLERAGMRTVAFCEIDPWCQRLLKLRWPGVPVLTDVRSAAFPSADIICGGFPCQDVSLAGKRAGVAGERSGLYREVLRAIRLVRPKFTLLENVAALLGNGMGRVLGDVAEDGLDAEWDCISAGDLGAPHGRDRVWIALADPHKLERQERSAKSVGWWLWSAEEVAAARDADGQWKLEPPRLLGNVRRWIDDAARAGAWWTDHWQEKFEAFRRMDDGVPTRLDRSAVASAIKPLGNTVVPQIPEIWGRAIMTSMALTSGNQTSEAK
jgi:DNA (cytosine-5)-methyltransferase 1